ncbi:MAG: hypothetical protein ABIM89_16070, partial [Mycobacteriales bacterium]
NSLAEAPARGRTDRSSRYDVVTGWECAPGEGDRAPEGDWLPAQVPGDVAAVLRAAGIAGDDLDARDWWFRVQVDVPPVADGEELVLHLDGVTPYTDVLFDGELVATVSSMHLPTAVPLRGPGELMLRCRSLTPVLTAPYRPRARWRAAIAHHGLRHVRTTLLGRAPGFAPGPPVVGPWRSVHVERRTLVAVEHLEFASSLDGTTGRLTARAGLRGIGAPIDGVDLVLNGDSGQHQVALTAGADGWWRGELRVDEVARWWPHTHGAPVLHDVRLDVAVSSGRCRVGGGRTGFRSLRPGAGAAHDVEVDGLHLHVNGVPVFARGAVWSRPGGPAAPADLRGLLEVMRCAGMNMVRIPGTAVYETDTLHDLCDELGVLVWQDVMLANFDAPEADEQWRSLVVEETSNLLTRLSGRPSTVVVCGGSEVEQQAAMTGFDPSSARGDLVGRELPGLLSASGCDAVWVPSSPCGGDVPFRTSVGIAHYFGVGGYRRPLSDVRLAAVLFASECLAIANLAVHDRPAATLVDDPLWLAGIPRDVGADWDFADVRDHYLELLYGVDAAGLRRDDPEHYLALSQAVSGHLAAEVMGEWRRVGSPCGGGLVLWLADQRPGPGWGLLDSEGRAKPVLAALRRVLSPVSVWTTDEGLDGIAVHVANDGPEPLSARLRLGLLRLDGTCVDRAETEVQLADHGSLTIGAEKLLGHFADVSRAYRFGPPDHDVVAVTLSGAAGPLATAMRWVTQRPAYRVPLAQLGLVAAARRCDDGIRVSVESRAVVHGVRVRAGGCVAPDDLFDLEPGGPRHVHVPSAADEVTVEALNALGVLTVPVAPS